MHPPIRNQYKFIRLIVMVVIILTAFWSSPAAAQSKIDPRVLEDTANGKTGHFLVYLNQQADARGASAAARNRNERSQAVFDALRGAAASSQPAVRAQLDTLGAKYRAYWVVNAFAVEGNRGVVE